MTNKSWAVLQLYKQINVKQLQTGGDVSLVVALLQEGCQFKSVPAQQLPSRGPSTTTSDALPSLPPSLHPKPAPPPPLLSWPSGLWLFCAAAWREHWNLPRANKALSQRSRLQHHQVSSYIHLALDFMLQEWVPAGLQGEEMQHFSFWVMMSEFRGVTSWLILTHVSRL